MGYDPICMIIMDCNQGAFISRVGGLYAGCNKETNKAGRKTLNTGEDSCRLQAVNIFARKKLERDLSSGFHDVCVRQQAKSCNRVNKRGY